MKTLKLTENEAIEAIKTTFAPNWDAPYIKQLSSEMGLTIQQLLHEMDEAERNHDYSLEELHQTIKDV